MTGYRQTLLVLLLTILSGAAVAQNNTNSPYTRYGYGQLSEQGSSNSRAMGGIAYGCCLIQTLDTVWENIGKIRNFQTNLLR